MAQIPNNPNPERGRRSYSAVIRTWNSERTLLKTIRSLQIQDARPKEIFIVDSGSSDRTLELAMNCGVTIIHYPASLSFNYSKALNIGIAAATCDAILIISSHTVIPYKNIAQEMLDAVLATGVVGAYCVTKWFGDRTRTHLRKAGPIIRLEVDKNTFDGYNGLWNTCSMIRKSAWDNHPFDETAWTAEDQLWALWHFQQGGWKTIRLACTGAIDLNPRRSKWKAVREHVAIASRCRRDYYRWITILRRFTGSAWALASFKRALFKEELLYASVLFTHRIGLLKFQSRYDAGPPWWLAWLAR